MPAPDDTPSLPRALSPATLAVVTGRPPREPDAPLNTPVTLASTYVAGGDVGYGRYGNPSWASFEDALAALEGGDQALAFASGMAAISAVLALVPDGGVVVAPEHAYSGSLALLAELEAAGRLQVRRVPVAATDAVLAALDGAAMLWLESPTNPALEVADVPACLAGARRAGALSVVDNTFATPLVQQPLVAGADVVVHSATKYLSGHSDLLLGAVVTGAGGEGLAARLLSHRSLHGATPSAFDTFLALRGLRTLDVRLTRAQTSARVLAERLDGHPAVTRVRYPGLPGDPGHQRARETMRGFGAIVSVELGGDAEATELFVSSTRLWVAATSLGGVESTLERRRRWPAESPDIPESLVRLSVGIEDVEDLWWDLEDALRVLL
ncbi:MAG: trans-sulfuration enzyme family protein [Actinomycetales bacterium]